MGFQGHPEYDELALLKEYRRDVGRYLRTERDTWPAPPQGYFAKADVDLLAKYRVRAEKARDPALLTSFPMAQLAAGIRAPWRAAGATIYSNWLTHLNAQRSR